jgi:hypothetical protein
MIISSAGVPHSQVAMSGRGNAGDRSDVLFRVLHSTAIDAITMKKMATLAEFI